MEASSREYRNCGYHEAMREDVNARTKQEAKNHDQQSDN